MISIRSFLLVLLLHVGYFGFAQTSVNCPPNINFEDGNLNSWQFYTGSCCPISTPTLSGPVANRHVLTNGAATDPYGGFPIVAPGGAYSLKLGNNSTGSQAERARYFVHVPTSTTKYILIFNYAVVFEDPNHAVSEQPRFEVKAYDSTTGTPISCASFDFVASSTIPGFKQSASNVNVYYKEWTTASLDLSSYSGGTVAVDFATGDCSLGAHFGYGYIDLDCKLFESFTYKCNQVGSATLKAPPGFQAYTWYAPGFASIVGTTQTITVSNAATSSIYPVVLTPYPGYGCADTLYAEVRSSIIKSNAPDTVLCNGTGSMLINPKVTGNNGPFTYEWSPAAGLSCTTCATPTATFSGSVNYYLKITDTVGCYDYDTVNIKVIPFMETHIAAPDTICQNTAEVIQTHTTGGNNMLCYWDLDAGGSITKGKLTDSITAIWDYPGLKKIKVVAEAYGCKTEDSDYVFVRNAPLPFFQASSVYACVGDTVSLNITKENAFYYWKVDEKDVTDTTYVSPLKLAWSSGGEKQIKLGIQSDRLCPVKEFTRSVFVRAYPDATISLKNDFCIGGVSQLAAKAHPDYIYDWRPVLYFLNNSTNEVEAEIPEPGYVTLRVTDRWLNKCSSMDSVYANPKECCDVMMPDAFTPNSDGHNDLFRLITPGKQRVLSFMVANRRGQVVYKAESNGASWDGRYNGVMQDAGTYMYFIEYMCEDQEIRKKKGSFHLIR
ncbi:gliding motility-associated C-terminal domain-containing protein [Polluticoccus soli]|uniref:T9SS type B sorting domain-containing protein n=1 Tax=Polluticoccus soli TaxID=3034150 RepID=UPI0023E0E3D6|nr:gliding motility-associated C-terminal domain-containing protein [Flavipsychrobacter sp. JY13-12]